jgi:hypothetical protein
VLATLAVSWLAARPEQEVGRVGHLAIPVRTLGSFFLEQQLFDHNQSRKRRQEPKVFRMLNSKLSLLYLANNFCLNLKLDLHSWINRC